MPPRRSHICPALPSCLRPPMSSRCQDLASRSPMKKTATKSPLAKLLLASSLRKAARPDLLARLNQIIADARKDGALRCRLSEHWLKANARWIRNTCLRSANDARSFTARPIADASPDCLRRGGESSAGAIGAGAVCCRSLSHGDRILSSGLRQFDADLSPAQRWSWRRRRMACVLASSPHLTKPITSAGHSSRTADLAMKHVIMDARSFARRVRCWSQRMLKTEGVNYSRSARMTRKWGSCSAD